MATKTKSIVIEKMSSLLLLLLTSSWCASSVDCDEDVSRFAPFILGGSVSPPKRWPFMAKIYREGRHHCGGVVWNSYHILTAAHCLQQFDEREFIIYLGHVNSFEMEAVVEEQYIFTVDRFIIHRDYVGMKRGYKNDIALIRLDREIDFESENTEVSCVCEPYPLELLNTNQCIVLGWGQTTADSESSLSKQLLQVGLPILSDAYCSQLERDFSSHWALCAGFTDEDNKDACKGDSGGPLLCPLAETSEVYSLAGIVSHGVGCGSRLHPGYYTRVDRFIRWIEAQSGE